jgi:DNA polymerase-2
MSDFEGREVDALYFATQREMLRARDVLRKGGVRVYESDISPPDRFLMERMIHGGVDVTGSSEEVDGLQVFRDPSIKAAEVQPSLSTMSFDIETGRRGELYSIAYQHRHADAEECRVLMVGDPTGVASARLTFFGDETSLLRSFLEDVARLDPDLLLGWNVVGFDLRFLDRKCSSLGIPLALGRRGESVRLSDRNGRLSVYVHGRGVVDGPPALRAGFFGFTEFGLDAVAAAVLGERKTIAQHGEDKMNEIERRFQEDKQALAEYNLQDCRLVTAIVEKLGLLDQMISRVAISGMLLDRLGRSVRAFDHAYLPRLHRKGVVAPNIDDIKAGAHAAGGLVMSPMPGLHEHVVALDFKSLYPTLIRTFKIDPLSRLRSDRNTITTPTGVSFSADEHILPGYIEELMTRRSEAQKNKDAPLSQAIKILMNSFYGVMGTPGCRFYHPDLPSAITGTGQWILRTARAHLESKGYAVLYGDTDSLFVKLKQGQEQAPHQEGARIAEDVDGFIGRKLKDEFGVESVLELEFEKAYRKIFFPAMRGREQGASKRYAGLVCSKAGEDEIEFVGLEVVRSDWSPVAKEFQRELFRRYFGKEELEEWILDVVQRLKNGELDDELVYSRRLRKSADDYTKSTPPHVKAVRMLPAAKQKGLRRIEYVMTMRGPVPLELEHSDLDYDHYIDKQLKPLADMVLRETGTSFDAIVGSEQLELFAPDDG